MKVRVTYIISNIDKALAFEWIATHLDKNKIDLNVILINPGDSALERFLLEHQIPVERIRYRGKKDLPMSIARVYRSLKKNRTTHVHTHLFEANLIGLTAAWLARIPHRIYTRHHAAYHHIYYPKAVKYDRFANYLSTDIVAISQVVRDILIDKESVDPGKIHLIHHGFLLEKFENTDPHKVEDLRRKYVPANSSPVVGVISRYIELKGIQYIIPAFARLLADHPNALLILANAGGDYSAHIKELLKTIPEKNYREITFEEDIFSLYKLFDIFVHVPITPHSEAFGQTYVESMASGVPLIATSSGIGKEILKHEVNCLEVPHKDSESIYQNMIKLLGDQNLKRKLTKNAHQTARENFSLQQMIEKLETLYLQYALQPHNTHL